MELKYLIKEFHGQTGSQSGMPITIKGFIPLYLIKALNHPYMDGLAPPEPIARIP